MAGQPLLRERKRQQQEAEKAAAAAAASATSGPPGAASVPPQQDQQRPVQGRVNPASAAIAMLVRREIERQRDMPDLPPPILQVTLPYTRPTPEDAEIMAWHLYTYEAVAAHCGTDRDTLLTWRRGDPALASALARGRAKARGEVVSSMMLSARLGDSGAGRYVLASSADSEFLERFALEVTPAVAGGASGEVVDTRPATERIAEYDEALGIAVKLDMQVESHRPKLSVVKGGGGSERRD